MSTAKMMEDLVKLNEVLTTSPGSTLKELMVLMDKDEKTMRMILDTAEFMGFLECRE